MMEKLLVLAIGVIIGYLLTRGRRRSTLEYVLDDGTPVSVRRPESSELVTMSFVEHETKIGKDDE